MSNRRGSAYCSNSRGAVRGADLWSRRCRAPAMGMRPWAITAEFDTDLRTFSWNGGAHEFQARIDHALDWSCNASCGIRTGGTDATAAT